MTSKFNGGRPANTGAAIILSAAFAASAGAAAPGTLALESAPCAGVGATLIVDVAAGAQGEPWVGGQAFIAYDTSRLVLVGPIGGDPIFDLPLHFSSDPILGHVDVAVGISPRGGTTTGDVVLVRLEFQTISMPDPCPIEELVRFRSQPPFETRLSSPMGEPIHPALVSLGPVAISDGPSITPPPDVSWALPTLRGGCVTTGDPGFASGSSPCGAPPVITWVRSDGEATLDAPYRYVDSPIVITWTATDDCGFTASADQVVTVTGCLADLTGDGTVDGGDLAILLGHWGPGGSYTADLNCDGIVNGDDLATLLGRWGPCP